MKTPALVLMLFLFIIIPLSAQEEVITEDIIFVINSINFNIKGITKPFAIIRNGELNIGEELNGEEKLDAYIADKTQLLLNQRVLEKVQIDYTIGEIQNDGKYPVNLIIRVAETWNIIALPYPKYDSNTGFDLILKARDYNFLGTMNPLRLDFGYKYDENQRSSLLVELESDTPFRAFGLNWNFTFNHSFSYRPEEAEPFYYQNLSGLSIQLPYKKTTFIIGFNEYVVLNEENESRYKDKYGEFQHGLYMASRLIGSWKIPTGLIVGNYGELTYWPELSATFNHEFPKWPLADFRRGPIMEFYHSLGFERINWINNYRKGLGVSFTNSYSYNFYLLKDNEKALNFDYTISGKGHFILSDHFGISVFLRFRHWFFHDPDYYDTAGDALRGIMDKVIHADYMLSLNLDFPVKILEFLPSRWFNTQKMRFFDFEMHASPIIDLALYHDPEHDVSFNFRNMLVSGGFELIIFPAFMRSLYLRISVAWNFIEQINNSREYYLSPVFPVIPHLPTDNDREIFIGIGHHY